MMIRFVYVCMDKWKTYVSFGGSDISTPNAYDVIHLTRAVFVTHKTLHYIFVSSAKIHLLFIQYAQHFLNRNSTFFFNFFGFSLIFRQFNALNKVFSSRYFFRVFQKLFFNFILRLSKKRIEFSVSFLWNFVDMFWKWLSENEKHRKKCSKHQTK